MRSIWRPVTRVRLDMQRRSPYASTGYALSPIDLIPDFIPRYGRWCWRTIEFDCQWTRPARCRYFSRRSSSRRVIFNRSLDDHVQRCLIGKYRFKLNTVDALGQRLTQEESEPTSREPVREHRVPTQA